MIYFAGYRNGEYVTILIDEKTEVVIDEHVAIDEHEESEAEQ